LFVWNKNIIAISVVGTTKEKKRREKANFNLIIISQKLIGHEKRGNFSTQTQKFFTKFILLKKTKKQNKAEIYQEKSTAFTYIYVFI